jgi:hypothetical protein
MRKGIHTIRTILRGVGSGAFAVPIPRRYTLDNGNWLKNMVVESVDFFPVGTTATFERVDGLPTYMKLATTQEGASFTNVATHDLLNVADNRAFMWGSLESESGWLVNYIDPDHVLVSDLWMNVATVTAAGTVQVPDQDIGIIVKMKQVKSTPSEAILQLIKEQVDQS